MYNVLNLPLTVKFIAHKSELSAGIGSIILSYPAIIFGFQSFLKALAIIIPGKEFIPFCDKKPIILSFSM